MSRSRLRAPGMERLPPNLNWRAAERVSLVKGQSQAPLNARNRLESALARLKKTRTPPACLLSRKWCLGLPIHLLHGRIFLPLYQSPSNSSSHHRCSLPLPPSPVNTTASSLWPFPSLLSASHLSRPQPPSPDNSPLHTRRGCNIRSVSCSVCPIELLLPCP